MRTLRKIERWPRAGRLQGCALSESGRFVAALDGDGVVVVRSAATRAVTGRFEGAGECLGITLSDDGAQLGVIGVDQSVRVHEVASGRLLWRSGSVRCGGTNYRRVGRESVVERYADQRHFRISAGARAALAITAYTPTTLYDLRVPGNRGRRTLGPDYAPQFSPDGRWIPRSRDDGGVQLWDWDADDFSEAMLPRGARAEMQLRAGAWRYLDPARRRFVERPRFPDKVYTRPTRAFAVSHGHPVLAWRRQDLIEFGPMFGPDYGTTYDARILRTGSMALDYAGEFVALAGFNTRLVLVDLARHLVTEVASERVYDSLVFAPSGVLLARSADHTIDIFAIAPL